MRSLILIPVVAVFVGCAGVNEPKQPVQAATEAVVATIGGALDDTIGTDGWDHLTSASCTRAGSCNLGTAGYPLREVVYDCSDSDNEILKGAVTLKYTVNPESGVAGTDNCSWAIGETVLREGTTTLSGLVAGSLTHSTLFSPNYEGNSVGGGAYVSKIASSGLKVRIIGNNVRQSLRNGTFDYEVSVKSTGDLTVSGNGTRSSRSVSGTMVAYHNTDEFTATYALSGVTWQDGCCFPVSGSMNVSFSGSRTGSSTVTFSDCGKYSLDGASQSLLFCQ